MRRTVIIMPECPVCDDEFQELKSLKLHMNPAHGWSLNDGRLDYLKERFKALDGQWIHLLVWVHEQPDGPSEMEETGEVELITGRLECDRLSNAFYNDRGEWTIQWMGGHGPVGGYWLHQPDPETGQLGLPSPTRRVIDVEDELLRVKVEIGDDTAIREANHD